MEHTEKVLDINHYDAAIRDPEVQSCIVLVLLKSSFEQVINKLVRVVGGCLVPYRSRQALLLVACLVFFFFLSLYAFPPKGALGLGYEAGSHARTGTYLT